MPSLFSKGRASFLDRKKPLCYTDRKHKKEGVRMKFRRFFSALLVLLLSMGLLCLPASAASAPELSGKNYLTNGNLRLTWTAVEGAASYEVYRSSSRSGKYTCIETTESTGYTETSAAAGKTHYYYVQAISENGESSAASNTVSGRRRLPRPDITLSAVSSSGKTKISWEKISGASSYRVYRSRNQESWTLIKKTRETAYTDTTARAGLKYYYKVRAVTSDGEGNSAYSSIKSRVCDLPRPVVTVSNVSSTGRVKLSWKAIDGAKLYRVYRATSKTGTYERVKSTSSTSYTDTTGTVNTTYYYKVMAAASSSSANSAYSAVKSGVYQSPYELTLKVKLNDEGNPYLTWNPIKGAKSYKVYRSYIKNKDFSELTTRTSTSYTNSNAPEGVPMYYRIKAISSSGSVIDTSSSVRIVTELSGKETLKTRYISVPMQKIYDAPTGNANPVRLPYMAKIKLGKCVIDYGDAKWYRVFYKDELMYLLIVDGRPVTTATRSPSSYKGETAIQQEVLDLAMEIATDWKTIYAHDQSEGIPNADGTYGFDCSGFVEYVLETVMRKRVPCYDLSASISVLQATENIYNDGYPGELNTRKVKRADLQPGDILFFTLAADGNSSTSKVGHCGIYLGNNEFVHATTSFDDAVLVMPLTDRFLESLHSIRRYLPSTAKAANTTATLSGPYATYRVYAEMDPDSDEVAYIVGGQKFTLLFTNGNWAYVRTASGKEGFIRAQYLA